MSETLAFVLLMAIGCLGLTVGLQPLFWITRNTSEVSMSPRAFSNAQVVRPRQGFYVKPVPRVPVTVRRVCRGGRRL